MIKTTRDLYKEYTQIEYPERERHQLYNGKDPKKKWIDKEEFEKAVKDYKCKDEYKQAMIVIVRDILHD